MLATPGSTSAVVRMAEPKPHQLNHRPSVTRAFQDFVGDQGDRLRVVEAQAAGTPAPGQLGGGEDRQALQFGGGQQHGRLPVSSTASPTSNERDLNAAPAFGKAQNGRGRTCPWETSKHRFRSFPIDRCRVECLCENVDVLGLLFRDVVLGAE